jgi:hypothetical protein
MGIPLARECFILRACKQKFVRICIYWIKTQIGLVSDNKNILFHYAHWVKKAYVIFHNVKHKSAFISGTFHCCCPLFCVSTISEQYLPITPV